MLGIICYYEDKSKCTDKILNCIILMFTNVGWKEV